MKKIISIIGARPQFIKHAPMQIELQKKFNALTIHTGQHYNENMSKVFFDELKMPKPDYQFSIEGATLQGEQTAVMMTELEKVFCLEKPDLILVYGDTNSTLAGVLIAVKMHIPIIHIEAGLRSYNLKMPEEINRLIADKFSDLLFCPTNTSYNTLLKEGFDDSRVILSGDVMCDMIQLIMPLTKPVMREKYYFATIHRPYNTDDIERLKYILSAFEKLKHLLVFSIHPRTLNCLKMNHVPLETYKNIKFIEPVGYLESINYQKYAEGVITDSGGMQKEAYMLQKKCVTIRSETEWLETLHGGWNTLLFDNLETLQQHMDMQTTDYKSNLYGDGKTANHITSEIYKKFGT